ncbi:MAG: M48 family metalloprotease [Candidatus Pacebacteria bacterium]|nr:M48 family metalloprotease [Candidatus Paceibacterota bacterium]
MNIGSYWFSDKLAIKSSGARQTSRTEQPDLWNMVENLSITAGLPMPKLYIIEDQAPNAFATGRNKEHSAVAVTTGLMQILDKSELEGVIAHELSHIGNRDILVMSVVVVLVGFIAIVADMLGRMAMFGGLSNNREGGHPLTMIIGILIMIIGPIAAKLMQMAVSRKREFLADASGALLTRHPDALASALEKISAYSHPMKKTSSATAHMFISNPFGTGNKAGKFIRKAFSTHPPMEERVAALNIMST